MESGVTESSKGSKAELLELFAVSFLSLFLELLFIRLMSADVRAFNIFKTFPLVACFIGLGVGCARRSDKWYAYTPLVVFLAVAAIKFLLPQTGLAEMLPPNLASYNWSDPLAQQAPSAGFGAMPAALLTLEFMVYLMLLLILPFAVMACIGTRIGVLFNRFIPLVAYAVNIVGALAGSIAFSAVSFMGFSPYFLIVPAVLLLLFYIIKDRRGKPLLAAAAAVAAAALCLLPEKLPPSTWPFWSPYQHLTLQKMSDRPESGPRHDFYWLFVNGRSYQACWDQHLIADPAFRGWLIPYWNRCYLPYLLSHPQDALVVAAGMGMDVQAAITGKARNIDAVDIDPVILALGKDLNPCRPYQSANVHVFCDDARHFFRTAGKKYDVVVLSHLDSQTVLGQSSSVRLDNFVYTRESFKQALNLLKDNGLLFVCFNAKKDWFRDRIYWTLAEATGYPPLLFRDPADTGNWSFFCVCGPIVRDGKLKLPPQLERTEAMVAPRPQVRILTDDSPYLYVQSMSIDWTYVLISLEILAAVLFVGRKFLFAQGSGRHWQLFFLGAAFLLLELQAISRLSLLYGTTWVTSSVVINGVLCMILAANLIVLRWQRYLSARLPLLYGALFAALAASYFLPVDQTLTSMPGITGAACVTIVTLLPMLIAGLIFPASFALVPDATALAFNLSGSVIGALLEYQANFTGINSLVILSAGLYLLSFLVLRFGRSE